MFTVGRLTSMIVCVFPLLTEGALDCPNHSPCMCGACSDSCTGLEPISYCGAGCQSYIQPDPGLGLTITLPVPVVYQLQICDVEEIEVEFRGCRRKVPYTPDEDGMFLITPPTTIADIVSYQCLSLAGPSTGLYPYINVSFDDKEIKVGATCSEPLYHGKFFGENDEIEIVGSCIGDGTDCNALDVMACDDKIFT